FFFQAEDGIRDFHVTGVQTCALPILALGVRFHTANFTYSQPDEFAASAPAALANASLPANATPEQQAAARALARAAGVLSLRPQQIDQLADVFKNRDPAALSALMTLLDMQTRQNIAEALAASGQLLVLTPQELGLIDRKSTRLNSSHVKISYAVFCLKK